MPGEAQKIEKMVEVFAKRYIQCNQVRKKKRSFAYITFPAKCKCISRFRFFSPLACVHPAE